MIDDVGRAVRRRPFTRWSPWRWTEKYARTHRLPFIDLAAEFPQDPALGSDAIHFTYAGLADGRLPKPPRVARTVHPAFEQPFSHTIALDALQAGCRQRSATTR